MEDAAALAHNAALLYSLLDEDFPSPHAVLERYSLSEIAALCEQLTAEESI